MTNARDFNGQRARTYVGENENETLINRLGTLVRHPVTIALLLLFFIFNLVFSVFLLIDPDFIQDFNPWRLWLQITGQLPPDCDQSSGPPSGDCPERICSQTPCPEGYTCTPITKYSQSGNNCCADTCSRRQTKKPCPDEIILDSGGTDYIGWGSCPEEVVPVTMTNAELFTESGWVESESGSSCCFRKWSDTAPTTTPTPTPRLV